MRTYLRTCVQGCRELGYVKTLSGRRRYLPAIKDTNPHSKSHVSIFINIHYLFKKQHGATINTSKERFSLK